MSSTAADSSVDSDTIVDAFMSDICSPMLAIIVFGSDASTSAIASFMRSRLAMMPLMPFVTKRVSSSARKRSATRRLQLAPIGVARSRISLPIEYMITLGWLKSFATSAATSSCQRSANVSEESKAVLDLFHTSVSSSITSTP